MRDQSAGGTHRDTYAVLMLGNIPERLFPDMETAKEYVESHNRLSFEDASIWFPIHEHEPEGDR